MSGKRKPKPSSADAPSLEQSPAFREIRRIVKALPESSDFEFPRSGKVPRADMEAILTRISGKPFDDLYGRRFMITPCLGIGRIWKVDFVDIPVSYSWDCLFHKIGVSFSDDVERRRFTDWHECKRSGGIMLLFACGNERMEAALSRISLAPWLPIDFLCRAPQSGLERVADGYVLSESYISTPEGRECFLQLIPGAIAGLFRLVVRWYTSPAEWVTNEIAAHVTSITACFFGSQVNASSPIVNGGRHE